MTPAPIRGLVLAGGRSLRMGEDKAGLMAGGMTLLQRAFVLLSARIDDVYVSVRADQSGDELRADYPLIEDQYSDLGPAAGILSAHRFAPHVAWLVIACDMPLLDDDLLAQLMTSRVADSEAVACMAADDSGPEPLCALYEPATLAALRRHVEAGGSPSPRAWLESRPVTLIEAARPDALAGANTKQEFDRITEQMEFGRHKHD